MWTSIVDLSPRRIFLTQLLGRFWRGAYFSSFAPLQVQNVPRQTLPSQSWVRVRNRLAGVCGSDLHFIYADGDMRVAPAALPGHGTMYLGHEVVGEVIEKGDDVQSLNIGDRVVLQHGPNCLSAQVQPLCRFCASGHYGLCEHGNLLGPHPIGGGWSEEMLLHEQQLFRISPNMTDEQAVMLEPSAVAVHAVLRRLPQSGDRVLIIGAGAIGLLTLQAVHTLAPQAEISVLARYPFQVEQATRMGAAHIIYPQDSYQGVQRATEGKLYHGMLGNTMLLGGYDIIYDTIGSRDTLHNALRWTRAKGAVVLVGLSLHLMKLDLTPIWYQEVSLLGTLGQGMEQWPPDSQQQRSTFSIAAEMIEQGQLRPDQLITHHFALNDYQHALMTAADKRESRAIKVVFDYSLLPASVVPNVRASAAQRRPATVDALTPQVTARIFEEETKPVEQTQVIHKVHETEQEKQLGEHLPPDVPEIPVFDLSTTPTTPVPFAVHEQPAKQEPEVVLEPAEPLHSTSEAALRESIPNGEDEPVALVEPVEVLPEMMTDNEQAMVVDVVEPVMEPQDSSHEAPAEPEPAPEPATQEGDVMATYNVKAAEDTENVKTAGGVEDIGDVAALPTEPLVVASNEEHAQEESVETKASGETLPGVSVPGQTVISNASGAEHIVRRTRSRKKGSTRQ